MRKSSEWIDKDSLFALMKVDHGSIVYVLQLFLAGGRSGKVRSFGRFIINDADNSIEERDLDVEFWRKCSAQEAIDCDTQINGKANPVHTGRLSLSVPAIVNFKTCMLYFHRADANDFWFGGTNKTLLEAQFSPNNDPNIEQSKILKIANKGGRPAKYDWAAAGGALAGHLHGSGIQGNSKLKEFVVDWFRDEQGQMPDERDIEKFVAAALSAFDRAIRKG